MRESKSQWIDLLRIGTAIVFAIAGVLLIVFAHLRMRLAANVSVVVLGLGCVILAFLVVEQFWHFLKVSIRFRVSITAAMGLITLLSLIFAIFQVSTEIGIIFMVAAIVVSVAFTEFFY